MVTSIGSVGIAISFLFCVVCIQESIAVKGKCGPWQFGACEKMKKEGGKCGRGTKKATRTGDTAACRVLEKNVPCKIPCAGDKKVCKYRDGQWGQCDAITLKRSRTDTLMTELSDPTCQTTRLHEKPCKKKACEYGPWTDFGACENGHKTKTRPILSGTQEECGGRKAKKTKKCSPAGARGHGPIRSVGPAGT